MTGAIHDVAVVGAGAAGLSCALALARDGLDVCVIGDPETRPDARTVALLDGSLRFLEALGLWPDLQAVAAPLRVMRLIDDTGSLFRPPPAAFEAAEIGLPAFGWNVENAQLVRRLADVAAGMGVAITPGRAASSELEAEARRIHLDDGTSIRARLVVAADGRRSAIRESAGIPARSWSYPQTAITALLAHGRDHGEVSTEFHTREGPFTLVPLPGRRSSLVWMMRIEAAETMASLDDEAFAEAVERRSQSLLGRLRVDGPRGRVPMSGLSVDRFTAERVTLVGEAAHVFPPIGAQGLNLGLRDAAALRDAVVEACRTGRDIGSPDALAVYDRGRRLDVRLRTAAVDTLNRTLLAGLLPVDLLRGAGLLALAQIGPLRRLVMREGLQPRLGTPALMQPPA